MREPPLTFHTDTSLSSFAAASETPVQTAAEAAQADVPKEPPAVQGCPPGRARGHVNSSTYEILGVYGMTRPKAPFGNLGVVALRDEEPDPSTSFVLKQGEGLKNGSSRFRDIATRAAHQLSGMQTTLRGALPFAAAQESSTPLLLAALEDRRKLRHYAVALFSSASSADVGKAPSESLVESASGLADEIARVIPEENSSAGAQRALLLHALVEGSRRDPRAAGEALQTLCTKRLDERLDLRELSGEAHGTDVDTRGAWSVAQSLSQTCDGLEVLKQLQPALMKDHDTSRSEAMGVFLQACGDLETIDAASQAAPGRAAESIARSSSALPGAPVEQASFATSAARAALKLWRDPDALETLSRPEKNAYFAWKQGFRDDSPGSALWKAQRRLAGMVNKWIPRAIGLTPRTDAATSTDGEGAALRRWHSVADRVRAHVGQAKSPLSSMRFGTFAWHGEAPKLYERYDEQLHLAVGALRQFMAAQIGIANGPTRAATYAIGAATLAYMERRLASASEESRDRRGTKKTLSDGEAERIRSDAVQMLVDASPDRGPADTIAIKKASQLIRDTKTETIARHIRPDIETLKDMRREIDHPIGPRDPNLPISRFDAALEQLEKLERSDPLRPKAMTADEIFGSLRQIIADMPSGDRVVFSGGGVTGLNKASVSVPIVPGVLSAGPNARATSGRHAIVELGVSAHAVEMFLGTEHKLAGNVGMSVTAGPDLGPVASVAFSAGASVGGEIGAPHGLMIRARSDFGPGPAKPAGDPGGVPVDERRVTMAKVMDLFERHVRAPSASVDQSALWNDFVDEVGYLPNLSISWNERSAVKPSIKTDVGLGAGAKIPAFTKIGAKVGASYDFNPTLKSETTERSGVMRRQTFGSGIAGQGTVSASLGISVPGIKVSDSDAISSPESDATGSRKIGLPSVPLAAASAKFGDQGYKITVKLTQNDGRYMPGLCQRDIGYSNPSSYKESIKHNDSTWRALLGNEAVDTVLANADKGNAREYAERWFLHPNAARSLDELTALADSLNRLRRTANQDDEHPLDAQITGIGNRIDSLLADEGSWRPMKLMSSSQSATQQNDGPNYFLMAQRQLAVRDRVSHFSIGQKAPKLIKAALASDDGKNS